MILEIKAPTLGGRGGGPSGSVALKHHTHALHEPQQCSPKGRGCTVQGCVGLTCTRRALSAFYTQASDSRHRKLGATLIHRSHLVQGFNRTMRSIVFAKETVHFLSAKSLGYLQGFKQSIICPLKHCIPGIPLNK